MTGRLGWLALAAVFALALVAAGCGDDDEDTTPEPTAPTADVGRYCELAQELDRAGTKHFKPLEQRDASRKQFEAAEREFAEQNAELFDEIQQVAPAEIQAEIEVLVAGQRARAGLAEAPDHKEERAAERTVQQFEQRNCAS
jgi:hypothetical protein